MAYTAFGADKGGADTISAADLNTYLKDNLVALLAHDSATAGVHGINAANYLIGSAYSGAWWEGIIAAGTTNTNDTFDITFTWVKAYTALLFCKYAREDYGQALGDPDLPEGQRDRHCMMAASTTGCTVSVHQNGKALDYSFHVVAFGF
jgi:hypothetical protein